MEQPVHIPGNDYLLKVTKISFAHKLNPTSGNDSIICNWHPIVTALNLKVYCFHVYCLRTLQVTVAVAVTKLDPQIKYLYYCQRTNRLQ